MNHGRKFAFAFLLLSILMLPRFAAAQAKQPAILQIQNSGTTAGTAANYFKINFTTGCTTTFSNGVFSIACTGGAGNPGGSANQIQYNNAGTSFGAFTMTGDCSIVVATGVITCTASNGTPFASGAFAAAYSLPAATSSVLGGVKPDGTTISNSSGAISLNLANANTWTATQTFGVLNINATGVSLFTMGGFALNSTFNPSSTITGSGPSYNAQWGNQTASTSGANVNGPGMGEYGTVWNGSSSITEEWGRQVVVGTGANPTSTYLFAHDVNSSSGFAAVQVPNLIVGSITSSTSPVCPNGTNAALTTSGCATGGSPGSPGLSIQGANSAATALVAIPGTVFDATNGITKLAITGPRPYIDPTSPLYGADPTGVSDSATAVQAALNACSGAAYPVVFPAGTYILDSIVTASNSCTVEAHPGTVVIKKNFNANASNNYTNPGYFLIAASNVTLRGLTFDCNYANFSGACVAAQGAISNITFDNGEIENCDGPCWLQLATSLGGQGPSQVLVTHSTLISGVNSTTTGAGGTISAKDSGDGLQYVDNPLIDGHLDTYSGSGTFELECGHPGAQLSNIQISGNPKIISTGNPLTGGGWAIQAGSFGCNAMYGLKIENNGLEVAGSVNGIVSIPSTYGAVVKGNHFNTHFRDLYNSASDGVSQISPALFTSASASFVNTIPGSATGRTLAYLCSGTWYYTLVSYASATTLTPATTPVCAGSSEQWELWGYSPTFTALELGNSIGPVVSGNTFDVESAQYLAAIWGDNTSDADISDNEILGFGQGNIGSASAGLVGIGMNAGYAENGISTITQVGHVITVTTESALIGQTQSAMKIGLCSPSNVCSGTSPYNFGYYQIDAVPTQLGTVFTVYSPTTGNACSGGHATCGYVEYVGLNNKVHGNKIEFAKILPLAGGAYGAQIKGASSTSVVSGDSVFNNTVTGTGAGTNEYCGSVQGTAGGVVDSNTIAQNKCVNTEYGFNRTFGTNTTFDKNAFLNVTTLRTGSAQSGEIWNWTPVGPLAFSFFPSCSATYEGALGFVTDSTTATNAATITGSGSNAVSAVCNGTNWVVTSGTGSGGGLSGLTTYTHLYASSATAAASVAPTTGYDGVPQVETNSTTAGAFTAAPVSAPQGVPVDIESGSTFVVALTDRYKVLNTTNATTSTAVTVPAPSTTGFGLNFVFAHLNSGSVVATDTPTTATVNGNSTMKLVGAVTGHNPEAAFWWEDSSTSCSSGPCYWGAEILPTDANGQLAAEGLNVANACPTCVVASSPGVGIAHFAGSTQTVTSSTIATGDIAANAVTLAKLATQGANTVLANVTGSTAVPTAAAIPAGVQFYTAGTGYSAATSANLLNVLTTAVTSAAALTNTAIVTGAGSQGSQTPDTTSTLSSGGVLALHTSTIPTFGTGAGQELQACGTAPTLVASTSFFYCNASDFFDVSTGTTDLGPVVAESSIIGANLIPKAIGTNPGVAASSITDDSKNITTSEVFVGGNKVNLTSDFTDSTSGSLVLITGLSYTLPTSKAVNVSFHCMLLYDQGSAAVVDEFGIGITGTAPTQANASATVYTSTTASTTGTLTALASTTPTLVVSFTPSAITTIWKAELDGTIEQPSNATPGVFSLYAFTTTGSDNLIVKRGSFCTLF